MRIAILAITNQGRNTASRLKAELPSTELLICHEGVKKSIEEAWGEYDCLICVMATGIVVRCISGLLDSKFVDPAVVVVDERGKYAISLLSGHIGGANKVVRMLAEKCGTEPVITTASDVSGHSAVDMWAVENNLSIANRDRLSPTSLKLLNSGSVNVYQEHQYITKLPADFRFVSSKNEADILISTDHVIDDNYLHLVPKCLFVGFGCRRGVEADEFQQVLDELSVNLNMSLEAIAGIGSIDLKCDEKGLLEIAKIHSWPVKFFTKEQINDICPSVIKTKVFKKVGVYGVCEPAAILAASQDSVPGRLLVGKIKWERITAAIAIKASCMS